MTEGWLQAPDARELRRYRLAPQNPGRNPTVFIGHGQAIPGAPALLKRQRRVPRDAALIEWQGLKKSAHQ
jgi:hypothetical protein